MSNADTFSARCFRSRFLVLLVSLLVAVVVGPLFGESGIGAVVQLGCLTLVFFSALFANRHQRRLFFVAIAVAAMALPVSWGTMLSGSDSMSIARYVIDFLFLGLTVVMILRSILTDYRATADAILGAACVYLLIGFMWALGYSAVERVEASAFNVPRQPAHVSSRTDEHETGFSVFIYFSFVTMSTLGYGDITPTTDLARTVTWMQSVTGQFYLAVLVARLVSALPASTSRETCSST